MTIERPILRQSSGPIVQDGTTWPAFIVIGCIVAIVVILAAGCDTFLKTKINDKGAYYIGFGTRIEFGTESSKTNAEATSSLSGGIASPLAPGTVPPEPIASEPVPAIEEGPPTPAVESVSTAKP